MKNPYTYSPVGIAADNHGVITAPLSGVSEKYFDPVVPIPFGLRILNYWNLIRWRKNEKAIEIGDVGLNSSTCILYFIL